MVKARQKSSLHIRSEVVLEDEKTKFGTEIDGKRVVGARTVLQRDEHTFKLGKTTHTFWWWPVVLSVSFSSKEIKAGKDPLAALRNRLEDTDIKVANNYIIGQTTHVVQAKRNTAKGLQALINGKYIVTEAFIDALIYATTPTDLDRDESLSPLEEDFDQYWPDAMQYVPPRGNEPRERPVEKFAPDPERANIFEGYTVVFCDKAQFDSLQAPITNGGGKALYFQLKSRHTTTDELVGFVKNVAGEKGLGELEDGSEGKGVVVVKFRGGKDDLDWAVQLGNEVSLALDLRFIEQNEFMDAILMNDASGLRRPLEIAEDGGTNESNEINHPTTQDAMASAPQESQREVSEQPPPPPRRQRGLIKSRFKGFSSDDDDEKVSFSSIPHENESRVSKLNTQPASSSNPPPQSPNVRKRPLPVDDDGDDDNLVDQLLPAATAMKRRRLEAQEEARRHGDVSPPASLDDDEENNKDDGDAKSQAHTATAKSKQKQTPIDIKASLRERRAAADEARARDEEAARQDVADVDIEALRNLAVVEEFDIRPRSPRRITHQPAGQDTGNGNGTHASNGRWDPAWNGRKNFKKFRPQGSFSSGNNTTTNGARRGGGGGQGVIVPLEEVKKRDFGIGEEYWLEGGKESLKRKRKERAASQSQSQSQAVAENVESESLGVVGPSGAGGESSRGKKGGKRDVPRELVVEDDEDMPDATQTQKSSAVKVGGRGGRNLQSARQAARAAREEDESESEDELKFRFGKRRRVQR
ncbi:MAG: hypothetical protein Q9219_004042 [cf. Caloplaca sp. 3 TL-2023]